MYKFNRIFAVVAALGLIFGARLAVAEEKAAKKETAEKTVAPAPKPPPELEQLSNMVGSWKCSSTMHMPPEMGGEQTTKSTMSIKKDFNGFWLVGQWKSEKTKTMPEMKGMLMWGYNPVERKFVEMGVDNSGSMANGTSDGLQGGKMVWNEEGVMMGKKMKTRTTVVQKTPREIEVKSEMEAEPGKWVAMEEDSCKK